MARPRRFERPTPAFGGQYSIQLSYGRLIFTTGSILARRRMADFYPARHTRYNALFSYTKKEPLP